MAEFNTRGEPTLRRLLKDIQAQIAALEVVDPRLESLRQQVYSLSIQVETMDERLRQLESHERTGFGLARVGAFAVFVVLVVLASRYL